MLVGAFHLTQEAQHATRGITEAAISTIHDLPETQGEAAAFIRDRLRKHFGPRSDGGTEPS